MTRNWRRYVLSAVVAILWTGFGGTAHGTPILSLTGGSGGTPVADSVHGWTFLANRDLWVTDLGLYDPELDGFEIEHDIGLFRTSDRVLLTSGTISSGAVDPLIDNFRYVDTEDVLLMEGMEYTIAYYSALGTADFIITNAFGLVVDRAIRITDRNWDVGTRGLAFPRRSTVQDRFGPNFLFSTAAAPEPGTLLLIGTALIGWALGRRRRRL